MKRSKPLRRKTPMRRKRMKPRRGRVRDPEYMAKVRRLPCIVRTALKDFADHLTRFVFQPNAHGPALIRGLRFATPCRGRIQADHMGVRGLGQKSSDRETAPMCEGHHPERTDYRGVFKDWTAEEMRQFCDWAIERTQHEVKEMG